MTEYSKQKLLETKKRIIEEVEEASGVPHVSADSPRKNRRLDH